MVAARLAKLVVVSLAAGATYGVAATLGSGSAALEAGSKVITSCGSGMTFAYTSAFSTTVSGYVVNGIDLTDIPPGCRDRTLSVTFYDNRGAIVGAAVDATLTASGTTQSIDIVPSPNTIDATRVSGVSVVVS